MFLEEMNMFERISVDPKVCHGKPVIKGTRILVSNILGYLANGSTFEDVVKDYPQIKKKIFSILFLSAVFCLLLEAYHTILKHHEFFS